MHLYHLLAKGAPVARQALADRLPIPVNVVARILDAWPGVFSDAQGGVVGYWGLALPAAYSSPHRLTIDGQVLSAWCAWDTLFLPELLGRTAHIESTGPTGINVRLTVSRDRVENPTAVDDSSVSVCSTLWLFGRTIGARIKMPFSP